MSVMALEGIIENGQIRLLNALDLPEKTRVYIIVPGIQINQKKVHLYSPRLVHPEQAKYFEPEVVELASDASL